VGVEGTYASDGDNCIGECMAYPYSAVEKLLDKYDVADILIMIAEVMGERAGMLHRSNYPGVAIEWQRSARIVSKAVSQLPKVLGIK
jgi:hypothetical protein